MTATYAERRQSFLEACAQIRPVPQPVPSTQQIAEQDRQDALAEDRKYERTGCGDPR